MFFTLQAHQYNEHKDLMLQMFKLRKRVFADELGWSVPVVDGLERDQYDYMNPVYLIWCSDDKARLYASLRLMPTTGPTLLHDVFRNTFPADVDLRAPGIWEATRMCCDRGALEEDHPEIDPLRAMTLMVAMICEVGVRHGIHTVISNYEPHVARVYKRAGARFDEIGRADGYGKRPVCCGVFEASKDVLQAMYEKLELTKPLLVGAASKAAPVRPTRPVRPSNAVTNSHRIADNAPIAPPPYVIANPARTTRTGTALRVVK